MTNLKKLPNAIKFALFASAASLATGNAFAQEAESTASDTKTLDRIEVTGSRIKRAEIEGALPVTVISRQDIDCAEEPEAGLFEPNELKVEFCSRSATVVLPLTSMS